MLSVVRACILVEYFCLFWEDLPTVEPFENPLLFYSILHRDIPCEVSHFLRSSIEPLLRQLHLHHHYCRDVQPYPDKQWSLFQILCADEPDRKSTRLNSSHVRISYAV